MIMKASLVDVENEVRTLKELRVTLNNVLRIDTGKLSFFDGLVVREVSDEVRGDESIEELREKVTKWEGLIKDVDAALVVLDKSRKRLLEEYELNSVGFGVTLLERDDVKSLIRGDGDMLFVTEIERMLSEGKKFPYGLDEKILEIFGENRRLYDKLLEFENVKLLIEKNDFYVANGYEIALKLYDMVYSGNISDKEYLKEYLESNGRVVDENVFDAAIKDLKECGDVWEGENEEFNPGNTDEFFVRYIKWW